MFHKIRKLSLTYFLNILGLTVALTSFIIIMIQVRYDFGFDNFYKEGEKIFRMEVRNESPSEIFYSISISRSMGVEIGEVSADIENFACWSLGRGDILVKKPESESYTQTGYFYWTLPNFEIFEFEILAGDIEDFKKPKMAVIPNSLAQKLFPGEDAIGQPIQFDGSNNQYTIAAIYKDRPENSAIDNVIFLDLGETSMNDPSEWSYPLFLKLNSASNREKVEKEINDYIFEKYGEEDPARYKDFIRLTQIHDVYYSTDVRYDMAPKSNRSTTISLLTIAIFIILIAIINFINLSMATVPLRIKSINTRKVLGSTNRGLITRQLIESIILAIISLGLAILIIHLLRGSIIANFVSASIALKDNLALILWTSLIAIATGIISGIYPAIYSTSFPPALVLKGSFSLSPGGRKLRSTLIAFQYIISITLIIVALYIKVQSDYMKSYDMGFKTELILNKQISNNIARQKTAYVNKLKENPNIIDITFADGPLVSNGKMGWGRKYKGAYINFDCLPVDPNFISFFDLKVYEGRGFEEEDMLKRNGTFVFNRKAHEAFELTLGDKMTGHHDEEAADIVGFVENFNFQPLQYAIEPISLYVMGSEPWRLQRYAYIKMAPDNIKATVDYICDITHEFDPAYQHYQSHQFMDEGVNRLYAKEDALATLLLIFCALSVFISVIGVLGLIFFETIYREKEIALRKVVGASISEILLLFNKSYVILTTICFVIASPIAWFVCKSWVKSFAYQSPVPLWIFLAAYAIILVITVLIITLRSLKTSTDNPVESIKSE